MKKSLIVIFCIICILFIVFPIISSTEGSTIHIKEMERISINIFQIEGEELDVVGYQVSNGKISKLPIGSTLDKEKGIFYWVPGPGFLGDFEFIFKSTKLRKEKKLRICISPKFGTLYPSDVNTRKEERAIAFSGQPFGEFSTPIDGSTVSSSIAVTGWALDDSGIENVKIYRGEISNLTYIGDAVLVEGARPDVAAAYPGYPNNSKAGWGYMLLTNFLPNSGNGAFKIHAIATAVDGGSTNLGVKTINVDNASAVKPFGAIDTPTQGGEASGINFRNNGWVITPLPNTIPTDGSTINVYIDGVNLGNPTYNVYREDIATYFPNYNNSQGAHAYFDFDTTSYSNGVHTIQWATADDAGNADGIGSRYFSINNSGTSINIEWVNIPAGNFQMGDNFYEGSPFERPVHTVYLSAYKISKYEVTYAQFIIFLNDISASWNGSYNGQMLITTDNNGCAVGYHENSGFYFRGTSSATTDDTPVSYVTWDGAKVFCDWMTQQTGKNIHLPTEAQWEKAARGTDQRRYPWGNSDPSCSIVNFLDCRSGFMPVGSYPLGVSPYGAHDMAGNVEEWCSDWYSPTYYSSSPGNNPTGPSGPWGILHLRVLRGGTLNRWSYYIRSAYRAYYYQSTGTSYGYIGFRLAQD